MTLAIKRATKSQAKARIALIGPSGSGKTYTSLLMATALAAGEPILVIDTEHGSASKYADEFTFDVIELESFAPQQYIEAMDLAEQQGYAVVVIDGLSHAWAGKDGILELVDVTATRSRSGSTFSEGWRAASPLHNQLVERLLTMSGRRHLLVTMRSKMAYVIETDEKGRQRPRKLGMQPVQREGVEYEFDIVGDLDLDNTLMISKTRCKALNKAVIPQPGIALARQIEVWLREGAPIEVSSPTIGAELTTGPVVEAIPHPTKEEMDALQHLAAAVHVDDATFWMQIKRMLDITPEQKITRKGVRERMTMSQYEAARVEYDAQLKREVEAEGDAGETVEPEPHDPAAAIDDDGEDVPDAPPPQPDPEAASLVVALQGEGREGVKDANGLEAVPGTRAVVMWGPLSMKAFRKGMPEKTWDALRAAGDYDAAQVAVAAYSPDAAPVSS